MPSGGRSRGEHEYGEPATAHGDGDDKNPSRSSPRPLLPLLPGLAVIPPASEKEQKKKQKHGHEEKEEEPAASFPKDILIDILSRVPYRSLCHFKCVSKEWLALCSDPDIRKRSPQTLSGFFYFDHGWKTSRPGWRLLNLSGKGALVVDLDDLPFLGSTYRHFIVTQCNTSLLLCQCWRSCPPRECGWNHRLDLDPWLFIRWPEVAKFDYVVCNPATQEWTVLPPIELPGHPVPLRRVCAPKHKSWVVHGNC